MKNEEQVVNSLVIEFAGDPSVGIFPVTWTLDGEFIFDSEEEYKDFQKAISDLFEQYVTGEPVGVTDVKSIQEYNKQMDQSMGLPELDDSDVQANKVCNFLSLYRGEKYSKYERMKVMQILKRGK